MNLEFRVQVKIFLGCLISDSITPKGDNSGNKIGLEIRHSLDKLKNLWPTEYVVCIMRMLGARNWLMI